MEPKKQNKQTRRTETESDTENMLMAATWEEVGRIGEKAERMKKYKLVVTEWSWGCKVQHRE